jgi:hypothetical protein
LFMPNSRWGKSFHSYCDETSPNEWRRPFAIAGWVLHQRRRWQSKKYASGNDKSRQRRVGVRLRSIVPPGTHPSQRGLQWTAPSSRCFLLPTFSLLRRALGVAATGLLARTDPRRSVIERAITKTFVSWRIMPFARRMRVLLFLKPLGSGQPAI